MSIELGRHEEAILGVLFAKKGQALFRMEISAEIVDPKRSVRPSMVGNYADTLVEEGLVSSREEKKPRIEGQARRLMYEITDKGCRAWKRMARNGNGNKAKPKLKEKHEAAADLEDPDAAF